MLDARLLRTVFCALVFCVVGIAQNWSGDFVVKNSTEQFTVSVDSVTGAVHVDGEYVGEYVLDGLTVLFYHAGRYFALQNAFGSVPGDDGALSQYPPFDTGTWTNVEL